MTSDVAVDRCVAGTIQLTSRLGLWGSNCSNIREVSASPSRRGATGLPSCETFKSNSRNVQNCLRRDSWETVCSCHPSTVEDAKWSDNQREYFLQNQLVDWNTRKPRGRIVNFRTGSCSKEPAWPGQYGASSACGTELFKIKILRWKEWSWNNLSRPGNCIKDSWQHGIAQLEEIETSKEQVEEFPSFHYVRKTGQLRRMQWA